VDTSITITLRQTDDGHFRADLPGHADSPIVAESLETLLDQIRGPVSDLLANWNEEADDIRAAHAALAEIETQGTIPWEDIKSELGL
jgi:hypothetical protein